MPFYSKTISAALFGCLTLACAASACAEGAAGNNADDQRNLISGLCTTQLTDLGASGCTCLAERALSELDENQRAYLIVSIVQPDAAEKMPIAKSKDELAAIFNFLGAAHNACVKPGASPVDSGAATPQQPAAGQTTQQ
jgi:hypothetical protein